MKLSVQSFRLHARRNGVWAAAVCAGLLAAWATHAQLEQRLAEIDAEARVPMVARVVAAFDLDSATTLEDVHVAVRDIPAAYAGSDTLSPEAFLRWQSPVLTVALKQGDVISGSHLTQRVALPLAARILAGRRAVTIPVDDLSSLSGLLKSGDFIDLYVSFDHGGRNVTAPLLQGVRVLAIGQDDDESSHLPRPGQGAFSTVTLDVSPEDAVKLVAARRNGTMSAILRRDSDARIVSTAARGDLAALLGMESDMPIPIRDVPVLYGNTADATLPMFDPSSNDRVEAPSGVFDLPVSPMLASQRSAGVPVRQRDRWPSTADDASGVP